MKAEQSKLEAIKQELAEGNQQTDLPDAKFIMMRDQNDAKKQDEVLNVPGMLVINEESINTTKIK